MTHLVRTVKSKNQTLTSIQGNLSFAHGELESLHLENASLTHHLTECTNAILGVVMQSFNNALHQLEILHCHLLILRIRFDKVRF